MSTVATFAIHPGTDPAFDALSRAIGDVFSIEPLSGGPDTVDVETWHLGTLMVGKFRAQGTRFRRSAELVAKSGLDHFLVQLYERGGFSGRAGEAPVRVSPGDVVIFDLAQTLATRATPFSNITLLIPRAALRDRIAEPALLHGQVLTAGSALNGLVADHLRSLVERVATLDPEDALAVAAATAAFMGFVFARIAPDRAQASCDTILHRAVRFIDMNLADPDLDVAAVARSTGQSRAALYRAFAGVGGVAAYIRRRRLTGAALSLSQQPGARLTTVARRWGFKDQSSFNRAFRAAFGVSPGKIGIRRLIEGTGGSTEGLSAEQRFIHWLRTLQA